MLPPQCRRDFTSDDKGQWVFYKHDAEDLFIDAISANGYESETLGFDKTRVGPLTSGECRTNVTLHLKKIESSSQPKETK